MKRLVDRHIFTSLSPTQQAQTLKPGETESASQREQIHRLGCTPRLPPALQGSPSHPRPLRELLSLEPSHRLATGRIRVPPSPPPNSTAPGKNVGACRRINKYLLFNQQYFDRRCKHGPTPAKPEPSWPVLQTLFFFPVSS